jgi:hypothetical protein
VCCGTYNPLFLNNYRSKRSGCAKRDEFCARPAK